jgi:hypothetical protein
MTAGLLDDELDDLLGLLKAPAGAEPRATAASIRGQIPTVAGGLSGWKLAAALAIATGFGFVAGQGEQAREPGPSLEAAAWSAPASWTTPQGPPLPVALDAVEAEPIVPTILFLPDPTECATLPSVVLAEAWVPTTPRHAELLPGDPEPPSSDPPGPPPMEPIADAFAQATTTGSPLPRSPSLRLSAGVGGGPSLDLPPLSLLGAVSIHHTGPGTPAAPWIEGGARVDGLVDSERGRARASIGGAVAGGVAFRWAKGAVELGWEGALSGVPAALDGVGDAAVVVGTGPRFGVRIGAPDRPGVVAQLTGQARITGAPGVEVRVAPWLGVTVGADLPLVGPARSSIPGRNRGTLRTPKPARRTTWPRPSTNT